ncbi:MAG: hypothetical protein IKO21_00495 [Fibrobacter sp.]|nr:hypothetical protein [Fibrobacter sp.]
MLLRRVSQASSLAYDRAESIGRRRRPNAPKASAAGMLAFPLPSRRALYSEGVQILLKM